MNRFIHFGITMGIDTHTMHFLKEDITRKSMPVPKKANQRKIRKSKRRK